jgi:hypothetical protein
MRAINSYPPHEDLVGYPDNGGLATWHDADTQANGIISGIDTIYYFPAEVNEAAAHHYQDTSPSFPVFPQTTSPGSVCLLANPYQSHMLPYSQEIVNDPNSYGPPFMWNGSSPYPSTELNAPALMSAPMTTCTTTPTLMLPVMTPPGTSQVQRRFACVACPKTFTSQSRADTCLFNHMSIKPFACNGACGIVGW